MEKAKQKNSYIWKRMGLELAALDTLIVRIQCDPDYCDVMDKQTLRRLYRLAKQFVHPLRELQYRPSHGY